MGVCVSALVLVVSTQGERSIEVGDEIRGYRHVPARLADRSDSDRPRLVWMGDSTLLNRDGVASFPTRINQTLSRRITATDLYYPGFDFYHHYFLMGPVLESRPSLVVLPVHLRLFDVASGQARNDLASFIPTRELPRALLLPLHARELTIPKLLLLRLLRFAAVEKAYLFCVGARMRFHEAGLWNRPGQILPRPSLASVRKQVVARYDVALHPRSPMLQMLSATVEMAKNQGTRTLVIVSPIPWQRLERDGLYEPRRYARRIDLLRETVEAAGGEFFDLHRALESDGFRDDLGHYSDEGAAILQGLLQPRVESLLFGPGKGT